MSVYVCFTFFNELDLLELQLKELSTFVDYFVLVESTVTFQGREKELYFEKHKDRFQPYLKQIKHVIVDDTPETSDPWIRENYQRNCIRRGLQDATLDSTVIILDVDEILRPGAIQILVKKRAFCLFVMDMYIYYFNWYSGPWTKAYGAPWWYIRHLPDLSAVRWEEKNYLSNHKIPLENLIEGAGWHFSWMGGLDKIELKLKSFSHTEDAVQKNGNTENLKLSLNQKYFFYDKRNLKPVPVDSSFPKVIQDHETYYRQLGLIMD